MMSQAEGAIPLLPTHPTESPPNYYSTERPHERRDGVTLMTPSPLPREDPFPERGRARTVSSIAPMPTSCYTINMFLFFLTCFQLMNLLTLTYTDSVLNYISKRFRIPNTMASFIPSSYQIGNMVVIIPVSFFGSQFNRPRIIAVGVFLMIIGLGCCVLPHFILPAPHITNSSSTDVCLPVFRYGLNQTLKKSGSLSVPVSGFQTDVMASSTSLPCNANGTTYNPAIMLIIGHVLIGCGAAPLWPLGVSYIDDHVVIRKIPVYLGIFIGTTLTGPVFGFLTGSVTSSIYVTLNNPHHVQPSNPAWIGAWWLGYLVAGLILILFLFPFAFYPASLPVSGQKLAELAEIEVLIERRIMSRSQSMVEASAALEVESCMSQSETSSVTGCVGSRRLQECDDSAPVQVLSQLAEMTCAVKRTLATPLVVTAIVAYVAMANLVSGVSTFGSTYLQRTFNVMRSTSDMLIGGVCIPLGILGTFCGGYLMKRYNFDIRQTLIYTVVMSGIGCGFFVFLFAFGCENQKIAGITAPYSIDNSTTLNSTCNVDCHCRKGQFLMVCGSDRTNYISPCYAGCTTAVHIQQENPFKKITEYRNCSCIADNHHKAVNGACQSSHCTGMLAAFMTMAGLGVMAVTFCQAPVYVVLLRVLDSRDKALGIGLMAFLSRVLGYIPGPIWFGLILDKSCIYWSSKCLGKSSCLLYNNRGLRFSYVGLCVSCAVAYVLVFVVSFVWMEYHKEKYEKTLPVPRQDGQEEDETTDESREWWR